MEIRIKKLDPNAVIPKYAKNGDAGMDLFAVSDFESTEYGTAMIRTGLSIEIPDGYVGLIFPRSSIYKSTGRLANSVGVIDSGYRGEIMVNFDISVPSLMIAMDVVHKDTLNSTVYKKGDKVAQLIVVPYPKVTFKEVKDLSETERGDGGFGSTDFDLTEIKKALYKEKPKAIQTRGDIEFKYYKAILLNGSSVYFKVPQEESLDFTQVMESQLLIRWITNKLY